MRLQLGDGGALGVGSTRSRDEIVQETYWNPDGEYDGGWERAGAESFMRRGYTSRQAYENGEAPVVIQKSGNPNMTVLRGRKIDRAGGNPVPTLMFLDDDVNPAEEDISGSQYELFQQWAPDPFTSAYQDGAIGENGVRQLAQNCAAIDVLGFKPTNADKTIEQFLTDGDGCFVVDFGADLGASGDEPQERMYNAGTSFTNRSDLESFEEAYETARRRATDPAPTGAVPVEREEAEKATS